MVETFPKLHLATLAAALLVLLTPLRASAQSPPSEKTIEDIVKQIQVLNQQLEDLRRNPQLNNSRILDPDTSPSADVASTNRIALPTAERTAHTNDPIARIREEGLDRSQVMPTLSYLTEVIGPRLTGSPNLKRANEWTRDKLASWGLTNAHLESWGPFGRGWSLKRFSAQIVEPQAIPLAGFPKAWTPGFDRPIVADVVYLDAKNETDLEKYKGRLKGAIVLTSPLRQIKARFEPLASRMAETNLLRLANAGGTPAGTGRNSRGGADTAEGTPTSGRGRRATGQTNLVLGRVLTFLLKEGAALAVSPSSQGDGGTLFVSAASLPGSGGRSASASPNAPRVWSTNAPAFPPQITLAAEDYNRLVRMIQEGERLKMAVDLQVQYHDADLMAYNTLADIPGSDLKDEVVMLGAHLDSWHSGTGATDNGAGVVATMEAMRILRALNLQPRRTIRIGLWSGEEQGLFGSKAYVAQHLGYYTNLTNAITGHSQTNETIAKTGTLERKTRPLTRSSGTSSASRAEQTEVNRNSLDQPVPTNQPPRRTLVRAPEYEKFSAYFNLDNGAGKIRGVYMQGNEAVRPLFRQWLRPFNDLGAETLTLSGTGGTDHASFNAVGLPGFQFIQDPLEYGTRTHHSNADVFDRIQADDLKQAATILAAFVYHAAMSNEKLPRKPAE